MSLTGDNVNNFIYKNYEQLHYIMNNINYLCDKEYPDLTNRQRNLFYKHLFTTMNTLTQSVSNELYEPILFYQKNKKQDKKIKKNTYFIDTILFFVVCFVFYISINATSLDLIKYYSEISLDLIKSYKPYLEHTKISNCTYEFIDIVLD